MSPEIILISAGEASGDAVGAGLVGELRRLGYAGSVFAVGGPRMRGAGAKLICDASDWGAMGLYQSLKVAPKVYVAYRRVESWLAQTRPALVIAIDFGYFNVRLCRYAKRCGSRTLYFMPPGSWRREKHGSDLACVAERIATPFPWSAETLREMGADVEWVGHPIVQMAAPVESGVRDKLALLPGSRRHEIENNLPTMARAVTLLSKADDLKGLEPEIALAPTADASRALALWKAGCDADPVLSTEGAIRTLKRSRVAVVCSGTATLEAAVCRTPMVVVYRGDKLMQFEYKLRRPKFEHVALPSILLRRKAVPELIGSDATPERIAAETTPLIADTPERRLQLEAFDEMAGLMGPPGALTRTAKMALEMIAPAWSAPQRG